MAQQGGIQHLSWEQRTHGQLQEIVQRGEAYALMRGSEELMLAWDRWTRVNGATRARGLHPARA